MMQLSVVNSATPTVVREEEVEEVCEVEYTTYKNKPAMQYMNNNMPGILEESNAKCVGITSVYDPNEIGIEEAWERITRDVIEMHTVIQNMPDVLFIVSAIEVHGAAHPVAKKPKIRTYDGSKEEEPKDKNGKKFNKAIDLSNPMFYQEESDRLRVARMQRERIEDEVTTTAEQVKEKERRLREYDESHGMIATRRRDKNGRVLMLDEQTFFRIEWESEKDPARMKRYFVVKEVDNGADTGVSLEGYPHVHMAVCQTNLTGVMREASTYGTMIGRIFNDVQVGARKGKGRKANWDNPCNLLGYVLKNSRHKKVDERLGVNKKYHVIANLARSPERMCNFMKELGRKKNRMTYINDRTAQPIAQKDNGPVTPGPRVPIRMVVKEEITTKKVDTQLEQAYARVRFIMENNGMRLCNGRIYQLVKGSKMTWGLWGEGTQYEGSTVYFMGCIMTQENIFLTMYRNKILDIMKENDQKILPTVELDCQWIEFGDCYMCMALGVVVKENTRYACIKYYPEIKWEDIEGERVERPNRFMEIIENSIKEDEERNKLCRELYKLYLPRIHKDPVLYLLGEPNSAKTTLIDTIVRVLPSDRRMSLANSKFALSPISDKYLLVIDEGQGVTSIPEAMMLKLLEGDAEIPVDMKHQTPTMMKVNMNIVIASNDDIFGVNVEEDMRPVNMIGRPIIPKKEDPIAKRLIKFRFRTLEIATPGGKEEVMKEQGKVIVWLARNYYGKIKLGADKMKIEEEFEEWKRKNPRYGKPEIDVSTKPGQMAAPVVPGTPMVLKVMKEEANGEVKIPVNILEEMSLCDSRKQ